MSSVHCSLHRQGLAHNLCDLGVVKGNSFLSNDNKGNFDDLSNLVQVLSDFTSKQTGAHLEKVQFCASRDGVSWVRKSTSYCS